MKAIKITKTVEEIVGYVASDGTEFKTEAECKKYEESAECAVRKMFDALCVMPDGYKECQITEEWLWDGYGCGSSEYCYVIVEIKGIEDVKVFNMYSEMVCPKYGSKIGTEYVGKRILVSVGDVWDRNCYVVGTEEEIVEGFKKHMAFFFGSEKKEG